MNLCSAGSGLVEVLRGLFELSTALGFYLQIPRGTQGISEHKEETKLTGSPEAVPAQRQ